ncbi:MAG: FAD-dependent oxidoreductase [Nitrosomonadaceae bacterium]
MKRLVLVGGGHAHLYVLRALAREKPTGIEIILISPNSYQNYSGMLPGWMAGHYNKLQCQIDLRPLVQAAHVRMVVNWITGMDADQRCVYLPEGKRIEYDLLSLDVGSETDLSWLEIPDEKLFPIRPLDGFLEAWPRILSIKQNKPDYRLVVIGGGAAGVELALAARYAFTRSDTNGHVDLVVSESGLLIGLATGAQRRIKKILVKAGVTVHYLRAAGTKDGLMLSNGTSLTADCVIAATGARAPFWLQHSKLMLDENEYIAVDGYHRSLSHPNVFAAGDVCSRQDLAMSRSGVHSVHAGPVLAANLLAVLKEGQMTIYRPRRLTLYLLACGPRYAVSSWGRWSMHGKWVWHWKDWIDQRFVKQFSCRT